MSLKAAKVAVCSNTSCQNNSNMKQTLCCSFEGGCADCRLHDDCAHMPGGMVNPVLAVCGNSDCQNGMNNVQTLVCSSCGQCSENTFHSNCGG